MWPSVENSASAPDGVYRGGSGSGPEVDADNAVVQEVHDGAGLRLEFPEFGSAEVAYEHRVLESVAVIFHQVAHAPQPLGIGDVVGQEVSASHYRVTIGT